MDDARDQKAGYDKENIYAQIAVWQGGAYKMKDNDA